MRTVVGAGLLAWLVAGAAVLPVRAEGHFAGFIGAVLREMAAENEPRPAPRRGTAARQRVPISDKRWLVIASREGPEEAVALAESYGPTLGPTLVMLSRNGRYAVLAGTLARDRAKINLETLKAIRLIPQDSFLSDGRNLERVVWHAFPENSSLDLMTRPAYRQSVRRLQASFQRLGLYDGPVDGLIGLSTADAFARFETRFGTPGGERLDDDALARIEETAVDGFGSPAERMAAQAGGFADAASFGEARAGGFPSATSFNEARSMGFRTRRDFDDALAGGFRSSDEFVRARAGGFQSASAFSEARRAGFDTAREFAAFRASGFRDAPAFREAARAGFGDEASWRAARAKALKDAREAADAQLSDADAFLRLNPTSPNLLQIAKAAADLKGASGTSDPDAVAAATARLGDALAAEGGFAAFAARRSAERAAAEGARRDELRAALDRDRAGLSAWIAANLTAPALPDVVAELDRLGRDRNSADIAALDEAHRRVAALLREKGLEAQVERLQRPANEPAAVEPDAAVLARATVRTPLNAVLLDGARDEVVVLYNADPRAPSLSRNLRGDFSFRTGAAALCTLGVDRTAALRGALETALAPSGARTLNLAEADCASRDLADRDLLILERGRFLDAPTAFAVPVLEALEAGRLRPYPALGFADLRRRVEADEALAGEIERDLTGRGRAGFGSVLARRGAVCAVDAEPRALHEPTLREVARMARRGESEEPRIRSMTAEDAFQAARRGECGAIYAEGPTLASVRDALRREGETVAVAPVWLAPAVIEQRRAALASADAAQRASAEARRLAADGERADAERTRQRQAETAQARERELRARHGTEAATLLNRFAPLIERFVRGDATSAERQHLAGLFPRFASWREGLAADAWEPVETSSILVDYGMARWEGRAVEAVALETRVRTRSRERGAYAEHCFRFAVVADGEFAMDRDALETDCDATGDALETWSLGHDLASRWRVRAEAAPTP
ncbi:peptidoglycan-binding domain-containing protein [Aureimonas jatrophae]|uniref:Peptidoglycan binding domain-containing protein n=1 Tax=Aureimonas jatrophae TaxID=1166073 RepID=A0A1H0K191_9HYPH|nr:peptidoglycan-binding domain-containing protein [Aureimonas jatrophae]MBB3950905.1 hypothetical protein [Aureimonas jatrophae]SDO49798.1 hypothetical protein SAMN05192530_10751 [Aureimonas jatrophae]